MFFEKNSSMGFCTKVQSTPSAAARVGEARRQNVMISLITAAQPHSRLHEGAFQNYSLICTGHHTFWRRVLPARASTNGIDWTLVRDLSTD